MAKLRKGVCLLLVLVFVVSLLPMGALADDGSSLTVRDQVQIMEIVNALNSEESQASDQAEATAKTSGAKETLEKLTGKLVEFIDGEGAVDSILTGTPAPLAGEEPAPKAEGSAPEAVVISENGENNDAATGNAASDALKGLADIVGDYQLGEFQKILDSIKGDEGMDQGEVTDLATRLINSGFGLGDIFDGITKTDEPTTTDKLLDALDMIAQGGQDKYDSFFEALKAADAKEFFKSITGVFDDDTIDKIIGVIGTDNSVISAIADAFKGGIPGSTDEISKKVSDALAGLGLAGSDSIAASVTEIIAKMKNAAGKTDAVTSVQEGVSSNMMSTMALSEEQAATVTSSGSFTNLVGKLVPLFGSATVIDFLTSQIGKIDELDELDEIWDEILDEFSMDDLDIEFIKGLISNGFNIDQIIEIIGNLGGGDADIDWDSIFASLQISDELLNAFKAWIASAGSDVSITVILDWFKANIGTNIDWSKILTLIISKLPGGSFDISAVIEWFKQNIGGNFDWAAIIAGILAKFGDCDVSVIIKWLKENCGISADIEAWLKLIFEGGSDIDLTIILEYLKSLSVKIDLSLLLKLLAQFGTIDLGSFKLILEYLIKLGGSFDLSKIFEIYFSGLSDFIAFLKGMIEIISGAIAGGFDISTLIKFLISLKGELGFDWSKVFEWLASLKTQLGIDWSAFFKLIFNKLLEFGANFIAYIKLIINWLLSLLDPKDPADPKDPVDPIVDPQTPLKPYDPGTKLDPITDPKTPLSPITGDETSITGLVCLSVLALMSILGMAVLAKPAAVAAHGTVENVDDESTATYRSAFLSNSANERNQTRPLM